MHGTVRDTWNSAQSKYDFAHIRKAEYTYDGYRGLRLSAALTNYTTSGSVQSSRTESYEYEEKRDFLTKVQYATNEMATEYAYDAAGNRTSDSIHSGSWTYDNLNNMLTSPNRWYDEHVPNRYSDPDVMLGRRKWVNHGLTGNFMARYLWDEIGRLTSYTPEASDGGSGAAYAYRADGMRIRKVTGQFMWWNEPNAQEAGYYTDETDLGAPTYRYFYDGQMMQEDDKTIPNMMGSPTISGNSYALGARGVDRIRPWTYANGVRANGTPMYPVYDGHGNMILTLRKDGGNFLHENERSYTVWGGWCSGADTGDPAQRYCASLGHVADDESSMIYMRARYYEPLTGRFISEDPAMDGLNWFVYCWNDPVHSVDPSGRARRTSYKFGDWEIAFDPSQLDWHAYFRGQQVLSLGFSGDPKHTKDLRSIAEWSARLLEDIADAVARGDKSALAVAKKMVEYGIGGFNRTLRRLLHSLGHIKIVIIAYTSIEAYAQYDPECFADTMAILGGFRK